MRVLVACEFSGVVRRAFQAKGHSVISVDLMPAVDESVCHIEDDVAHYLTLPHDLVIAHPPCTRLANSGVRWLHERSLWSELESACEFFLRCLNANAPRVAVENPVMHRHARERIGRGPDFTCQPWQFGDEVKKRTCFWLKGLPALTPVSDSDGRAALPACHMMPPSKNRARLRSVTPPGLARAMAEQWGALT